MHPTGSYLLTVIERMRAYLDEVLQDAKYTNDWIVRHIIAPETVNVLSRLNMDRDDPLVVDTVLSVVGGTRYYAMPPNVGEVLRIAELDENGCVRREWIPGSEYKPTGVVWRMQGSHIEFNPVPDVNANLTLRYIPNGQFMPVYSNDGVMTEVDGSLTRLTLGNAPLLGQLDERENGYVGGVLRILRDPALASTSAWTVQESEIVAHDSQARTVDVRVPFGFGLADEQVVYYEIAPQGLQSLFNGVVFSGVVSMATMRNVSQKQMAFFVGEYRKAMKTIMDSLSNRQMRVPKSYEKDTVDNRDRGMWWSNW